MASGAAVIEYRGKRGTSWRIKYVDAAGRQVMETLGRSPEWNRKRAKSELRARLVEVEREGYRKPEPLTFATFAREYVETVSEATGLKTSTRKGYRTIVEKHLIPTLGTLQVADVTVERIERLIADKRRDGLAPATLHRMLAMLSSLLGEAARRGLIRSNPVPLVKRPKARRQRWAILSPVEVVAVERAFGELVAEAEEDRDRDDLLTARAMFVTLMGVGLRRGEVLGLRWRHVSLADPDGPVLRVEETWVRNRIDTPKSEAGRRTVSLGARVAGELFEQRRRSPFRGEDERVFPNPRTGNAFDVGRYSDLLGKALARAGVDRRVRPFHDLRHGSITNAAAAGTPPEALISRAGHSDYATTRRYIDLAGERFRGEADRLERRLWGENGRNSRYNDAASPSELATEEAGMPLGE